MDERDQHGSALRHITSEGLSLAAVRTCWTFAVLLLGAGITATFIAEGGPQRHLWSFSERCSCSLR